MHERSAVAPKDRAPAPPPTAPSLPSDVSASSAKAADDDATVVARPAAARLAEAAPPYPPLSAGRDAGGDDLRAQIRAIVEDAVGPWQRVLQNQQRTVLELLQRLEDMERRIPSAARGVVGAGLPNLAPSSVPPAAGLASSSSVAAPPAPAMFSAPSAASKAIELSSAEQRVLAALEGRSRRRHLVLTAVLVIVLLFGGLGLALALSYMPHSQ